MTWNEDALYAAVRHVAIALDLVRKVTDDVYAADAEDELEIALDNLRSVGLPEVKAWWWVDEAGVYHYETGPLPEGEQTGVCLGDSTWVGLAEGKPQP